MTESATTITRRVYRQIISPPKSVRSMDTRMDGACVTAAEHLIVIEYTWQSIALIRILADAIAQRAAQMVCHLIYNT